MIPKFDDVYGTLIIFIGALMPFILGTWRKGIVSKIFALINLIAIPITLIWIFKPSFVPQKFFDENMLPFIYYRITLPVATLLPIVSLALPFLLNYGLMEFIGVFFNPLMRPVFKTPGKSAVDISASFVGGCAVGVLITNRTYKEGGYTKNEATIIATGFSTVAISIADMFLPASIVGGASLFTQATIAIVCIAEVIFFTGSIPCLLTSDMEILMKDIIILWIERVILALILASLMVRFVYPLFGIPIFS